MVPRGGHLEGGPRRAILVRQAEAPARHGPPTHRPLVGPGKDAGTRHPTLYGRFELPVERFGLHSLALSPWLGRDTHLAQNEWAVACQRVKTGQVAAEVRPTLEEHVESEEVEALEREIFRRRVVGVGDELVGVLLADDVYEPAKRGGDELPPYQRSTSAGISFPSDRARTDSHPARRRAVSRTSHAALRATARDSRREPPSR